MRLKIPAFWYGPDGPLAVALSPLSLVYDAGRRINNTRRRSFRAGIPVICVGNLVAGGSGKTPAAIGLMNVLRAAGLAKNPCFLTRGYGGHEKGPLTVDPARHDTAAIGDEPLLLCRHAPVIVAADRARGAAFAQDCGHDLIVMDDGLQNPGLMKTVSFAVIDAASGFGNCRMLPAGPLRLPLREGLDQSDAFIVIGDDAPQLLAQLPPHKPVLHALLKVAPQAALKKNTPYIAFCGIAHPQKFKTTLSEHNVMIAGWRDYPDHYPYEAADIRRLAGEAAAKGARLVTTEKDAVRIAPGLRGGLPLDILPVQISWRDETAAADYLRARLHPS